MPNPEEYRRTRRIVDLLLRIARQPRYWTRRALAEQYELSEKQIDKDVLLLRHGLRMPLRHAPEGYYFDGQPVLPILTLTLPEALSLLLAARLGYVMPGVPRDDLAAAIARVEALLPRELLPLVSALGRERREDGSPTGLLRDLQMATAERAQLRILYRSASHPERIVPPQPNAGAGGPTQPAVGAGGSAGPPVRAPLVPSDPAERTIDPYALVPYLKSWYLVAYCHLRSEVRMFKVDRIDRIVRTGERFSFPEGFDVADYMGHTWGLLRGEAGEPEEVVLEFVPEAGLWVRDQQLHETQRAELLPDGTVRLSFYVGITPELRRWVLGFGRQVRVVCPASLAGWVKEEARAVGKDASAIVRPGEIQDDG